MELNRYISVLFHTLGKYKL